MRCYRGANSDRWRAVIRRASAPARLRRWSVHPSVGIRHYRILIVISRRRTPITLHAMSYRAHTPTTNSTAIGGIRPSVCPFVCSHSYLLNRLTFDHDFRPFLCEFLFAMLVQQIKYSTCKYKVTESIVRNYQKHITKNTKTLGMINLTGFWSVKS